MIVIPNTDAGLRFLNLFWAAVQRQAAESVQASVRQKRIAARKRRSK